MQAAVLADVHGNLAALEAVLAEVERGDFDVVVSAGDVVAGPQPREVLERLAALGDRVRWVMGNADREVVAAFDGQLPNDPDDPVARTAHFAAARLERSGAVLWVNAGSVGMPYEGAPGAYWLALTSEAPDLRRTPYDVDAALREMRATGYPDVDDVAAAISGTVSRVAALDVFSPRA